ncbi:hypothetical protein [Pectobacterium brasiliense]|uniref:hypothetical protein n=1 Tax=Pectobacterium brasiliense TaxID=180957 RepID=UPI001968B910|nr:hypothetical protein [Pectobacterium brasiliense]MBN3055908.1 hypothetical protein [Pectobacterium brasiliense]
MSFTRIKNTLCPYKVRKLTELDIDLEHVLPAALGAPKKFGVMAAEKMNKHFNKEIDEPFIDENLIRFLSAISGVKSRSGKVNFSQKVTDTVNNEDVVVRLNESEFIPKIVVPVKRDCDGNINAVVGFGDDAKNELDKISKKLKDKGLEIIEKEFQCRSSSPLKVDVSLDLNFLELEILKISYLLAVYVFGDEVILTGDSEIVRNDLFNNKVVDSKLRSDWSFFPEPLHPETKSGNHTLFCIRTGDYIVSSVCLFGVFKSSLFFLSKRCEQDEIDGGVFYIDPKDNKMINVGILDYLESHMSM